MAAEPLCFPTKVLDAHAAVLGKTGAGKSSAMRHVVEHLLSHRKRVCIIDPKGDWWGIKSSADGKGPGFPVVTFGDFKSDEDVADVPINEESGKDLAELVTDGNRPAVIGMRGWFTAHMLKFFIDFAKGVFHGNRGEFYLFIDEVQNFAPKGSTRTIEGQGGLALHWCNRLLAEGRGLGINIWIGSQRPQKVHNDTLDGCETLVAMRSVHPAARGSINDWMKGAADKEKSAIVNDALGAMKRGEAIIWSPEIEFGPEKVEFPMFTTFDSFAPPQLQKKVHRKGWASVDLDVVKTKLARIVEEKEQNDPARLHRQIHDLERQLHQMEGRVASSAETVEVEKEVIREIPVFEKGQFEEIEKMEGRLFEFAGDFWKKVEAFQETLNTAGVAAMHPNNQGMTMSPVKSPRSPGQGLQLPHGRESSPKPAPAPKTEPGKVNPPTEGLTPVGQRILDGLAELELLKMTTPKRSIVALITGYTNTTSKGFANAASTLSGLGLIFYPDSGKMGLTDEGRKLANYKARPRSTAEVQQRIFELLGGKSAEILKIIVDAYPHAIARVDVASNSGYSNTTSKGFANALSRLSGLGFIKYPNKGEVKASEDLFLR
jgi:hypothetical protein